MRNNNGGFSLLELIVVITIIAILAVAVMPLFKGRETRLQAKEFVAKLNLLMQTSWQQALVSGNVQKVHFNFKKKIVELFEIKDGSDVRLKGDIVETEMAIPEAYFFRSFYIDGKDEIALHSKAATVYFFIASSGVTQAVIINVIDQGNSQESVPLKFGLVLNPFSAQFEYYDTFQKP